MIVSNTSPIIFLAKLRKLNLLFKCFGVITIPKEVYNELYAKNSVELEYINSWKTYFDIVALRNNLNLGLDPGETAAISLAVEKKAELILLDDHSAKIAVESLKLKSLGTLGVLLFFLKKRLINLQEFKAFLNMLINNNFRISIEVYNEALTLADEICRSSKK